MWQYRLPHFFIESEIQLPSWTELLETTIPLSFDRVTVRFCQRLPEEATLDSQPRLRFSVVSVGEFLVQMGGVLVSPAAGVELSTLAVFIQGSAWSALEYLRGHVPFHASAVRLSDGVVAFCAPPGAGKSTLAARLSLLGHDLFFDDLGLVEVDQETPVLQHVVRQIRLCPDAAARLGYCDSSDPSTWPAGTESCRKLARLLETPTNFPRTLPLRAIYLLRWGDLHLQRLRGSEAVRALVAMATYRPRFIEQLGIWGHHWQFYCKLAAKAPVYALHRPKNWDVQSEIENLLRIHWREDL
jgi:hypothetical protein